MTWNVAHNFPGAKDTYEVPVDYPDVGYDTIIASWFTDIFTSILAMQDSLLDLVGKVLLLAGGTMTGDITFLTNKGLRIPNTGNSLWISEPLGQLIEISYDNFTLRSVNDAEDALIKRIFIESPADIATMYLTALKLVIDQDIEVTDKTKGLIIKSPNNTRYRIKVADDGTLSTEGA